MCGIIACFSTNGIGTADNRVLRDMLSLIAHRGPDGHGTTTETRAWLGQHRLAIQDLSPAGKQPMEDKSGRYVIVYNGEVYNAPLLREELINAGHHFESTSDTEVIIEGFAAWGNAIWQRLQGIFACALYDRKTDTLTVCRDPLGIKPLYMWKSSDAADAAGKEITYVASEYKAFFAHPEPPRAINKESVARVLAFRYNPTNDTLLRDVTLLTPGVVHTFSAAGVKKQSFWSWNTQWNAWNAQSKRITTSELAAHLADAVKEQLLADVPIALLLSGGLDSAAIGAYMHQQKYSFTTYTAAYDDKRLSDAQYARMLSHHWGTHHEEIPVASDSLSLLPETVYHMDDTVADPSSIPQLVLAKAIRKKHKVVLGGGGGDELFGGYTHYRLLALQPYVRNAPLRHAVSAISKVMPPALLGVVSPYAASLGKEGIQSLAHALAHAHDAKKFYRIVTEMSSEKDREALLANNAPNVPIDEHIPVSLRLPDDVTRIESQTFLQHDVLMQSDKLFMSQGIEARVPLLHLPLVRMGLAMPFSQKANLLNTKILFRKAVARALPSTVIKRPKQGFFVPIDTFQPEVKGWIENVENGAWRDLGIRPEGVLRFLNQPTGSLARARVLYSLSHLGMWHTIFINSEEPARAWKKL